MKVFEVTESSIVIEPGRLRSYIISMIAEKIAQTEDIEQLAEWLKLIVGKELNPRGSRYMISDEDIEEAFLEAHGNKKIYDKCWKGYRKVKGKKRGEKGSCVKEGIPGKLAKADKTKDKDSNSTNEWSLFGDDEPEVNKHGFPYYTGDEEKDLPVVAFILKAYKGNEGKTQAYLTKMLKYPSKAAGIYLIGVQIGHAKKYPAFKKSKMKETATAGATSSGAIASVANPLTARSKSKKKGKYGAPKAPQLTNSNGTAKNALDVKNNLMGGTTIKR